MMGYVPAAALEQELTIIPLERRLPALVMIYVTLGNPETSGGTCSRTALNKAPPLLSSRL
jgi:hypothetical protein